MRTKRWVGITLLSAAILSCGGSEQEATKGSCPIGPNELRPSAIATPEGQNTRVTGLFSISETQQSVVEACLLDLSIGGSESVYVQFFHVDFGGFASDLVELTSEDLTVYDTFAFALDPGDERYSVEIYADSERSVPIGRSVTETVGAVEAREQRTAFGLDVCGAVPDSLIADAFPELAGAELTFVRGFICNWSNPDERSLTVTIYDSETQAEYIENQRGFAADSNDRVDGIGELATYSSSSVLLVFSNEYLLRLESHADVPDRQASLTRLAQAIIDNL